MSDISVGMVYTPVSMEKIDLSRLSCEIEEDGRFIVEHPANDYCVSFSSLDEDIEISVYFSGMVYYIKMIKEEDFTSGQMFNIAKEGFDFIQNSSLRNDYFKRQGLVITGKEMKRFYVAKKRSIKDFGIKLFKKPGIRELKKTDSVIHLSIVSEELPLLSFAFNN